MKTESVMSEPCSECGGKLQPRYVSQEFEREGIKIKLSGIRAWVCRKCGEIYFLPGGSEKIVRAANALFELAAAEHQHKQKLVASIR